jgi:hypothetical protein
MNSGPTFQASMKRHSNTKPKQAGKVANSGTSSGGYVMPSVEGYFHLPALWVGSAPPNADVLVLNPAVHHEIVYESTLKAGMKVCAHRDGLFRFDFSSLAGAEPIRLPPEIVGPEEAQSEAIAIYRAKIMNVHQACLTTAVRIVERTPGPMGSPVSAWETTKQWSFQGFPKYRDEAENFRGLVRNVIDNSYRIERAQPFPRRVLTLPVIAKSFELLDSVLRSSQSSVVEMVSTLYLGAFRSREHLGDSMALVWTVCEQLLNIAWRREQSTKKGKVGGVERMNRDRREKLNGRDYTASVVTEFLELLGVIDFGVYRKLQAARTARNDWAHKLLLPTIGQVGDGVSAAEHLFLHILGIKLHLSPGVPGGVPLMPVKLLSV